MAVVVVVMMLLCCVGVLTETHIWKRYWHVNCFGLEDTAGLSRSSAGPRGLETKKQGKLGSSGVLPVTSFSTNRLFSSPQIHGNYMRRHQLIEFSPLGEKKEELRTVTAEGTQEANA